MSTYIQADRLLTVTTPLGKDVLLLLGFNGQEAISHLFNFQLDLIAENKNNIAFEKLLGQKITINLSLPEGKERYFNGICNRVSQGERDTIFTKYRVEIVPELWLLTRSAQSRIFQRMSIPDILKKVLEGLDVAYEIMGTFHPRDYCVQYRETDFNFASRLMEEEGIYYFFKHTADGHKMVLANTPGSHPDLPEQSRIIYEEVLGGNRDEDRVYKWEKIQELRSGKYTLWDHSFELSHRHLEAQKSILPSVQVGRVNHKLQVGGNDELEIYDYPGEYAQRFDGVDRVGSDQPAELQKIFQDNERTVGIRMDQEAVPSLVIQGVSNCRQFVTGHRFTLDRHFNANGQYLMTGVRHAGMVSNYRSNETEFHYQNSFTCIPFELPFRPPRTTPKPFIQGTQTAVVVGPSGEEIFTDKYGRVKVQFHWDRDGKYNVDSSCWIRVAQIWSGKRWGSMYTPRIGHEVVVDFQEGDPDQPIIIGSVYNDEEMPHYKLPEYKTLSYIKSNSSLGGKGFNELRFEDKKGQEQVFIHSQKRMDVRVKGSYYETNHADRHAVIGWEKGEEQGGDFNILVKNDNNIHIKGGLFERVEKKLNQTVVGDVVYDFESNDATAVKGKYELNARQITIEALTQITLKVGASFIVVDLTGITIQGPIVRINSGGAATGTSPVDIEDPLDANTSDTGEPGYLSRLPKGGPKGRRRRTLNGQHGPAVTRNADGSFQIGKNISIDGKNPDFAAKALTDLAIVGSTPTGKKLLDDLDKGTHKVKIKELDLATAQKNGALAGPDDPAGAKDPKKGSDTTVSYNPDLKMQMTDQNGNPVDVNVPAFLGHELIHANHNSHGTNERDKPDPKDASGNQEESRTIGINDHKDEEISENNLLKDLGAGYQRVDHDLRAITPPK